MNATIHPRYDRVSVRCTSCGAEFETRSTSDDLRVDVCSSCHPFYTGTAQRPAAGGRIARFEARRQLARR